MQRLYKIILLLTVVLVITQSQILPLWMSSPYMEVKNFLVVNNNQKLMGTYNYSVTFFSIFPTPQLALGKSHLTQPFPSSASSATTPKWDSNAFTLLSPKMAFFTTSQSLRTQPKSGICSPATWSSARAVSSTNFKFKCQTEQVTFTPLSDIHQYFCRTRINFNIPA